jgi:hypothetical protein
MNWKKDEYLASWPKAVPYPYALQRSKSKVPNRSAIDWPQSQWAPLYLQPGSPSVQPYRYPANGPIKSIVPHLHMIAAVKHVPPGPAGDTSAVASGACGASSATQVAPVDYTYGEFSGEPVRMGMRPAKTNPCGCDSYSGVDCGCPGDCNCRRSALNNPEEGEESFIAKYKWYLAGAAAVAGYLYFKKK